MNFAKYKIPLFFLVSCNFLYICQNAIGINFEKKLEKLIPILEEKKSSNLLFEETFENESSVWKGIHKQFAEEHSFTIVDDPVFKGKAAGKFELRQTDRRATKNGLRSEVLFPLQEHPERWYSFAVYFPSDGWGDDPDNEVVSQWHSPGGTPTLALRVRNGDLRFRVGHDPNLSVSKWAHYSFGKLPKDEWIEFVFHIIHSDKWDGLAEVWKNGEKVVTHNGPNQRPNTRQATWKIGIYKSTWAKKETTVDFRITYFDNVKIGNEFAQLEEMKSSKIE
jgi:hypothetical protein